MGRAESRHAPQIRTVQLTDKPEETLSKHVDTLDALDEMQQSKAYAVHKHVLASAERIILELERALADSHRREQEAYASLTKITRMAIDAKDARK